MPPATPGELSDVSSRVPFLKLELLGCLCLGCTASALHLCRLLSPSLLPMPASLPAPLALSLFCQWALSLVYMTCGICVYYKTSVLSVLGRANTCDGFGIGSVFRVEGGKAGGIWGLG